MEKKSYKRKLRASSKGNSTGHSHLSNIRKNVKTYFSLLTRISDLLTKNVEEMHKNELVALGSYNDFDSF